MPTTGWLSGRPPIEPSNDGVPEGEDAAVGGHQPVAAAGRGWRPCPRPVRSGGFPRSIPRRPRPRRRRCRRRRPPPSTRVRPGWPPSPRRERPDRSSVVPGTAAAAPNAVTESGPGVPDSTCPTRVWADDAVTPLVVATPPPARRTVTPMAGASPCHDRGASRKDFISQMYRSGMATNSRCRAAGNAGTGSVTDPPRRTRPAPDIMKASLRPDAG